MLDGLGPLAAIAQGFKPVIVDRLLRGIEEMAEAACILAIGTNTTAAHPVLSLEVKEAVRRGATLIVANPKEIDLAEHAQIVLRHRAGTDVALLNAMMNTVIEQGLVDEVRALFERGDLNTDLPAVRAVGYRQVWAYLAGELEYDDMVERAITATRQYAKRQMTWFRGLPRRGIDVTWIGPEDHEAVLKHRWCGDAENR